MTPTLAPPKPDLQPPFDEPLGILIAPDTAQGADEQSQKSPGTVGSVVGEFPNETGEPWSSASNAKASDDLRATNAFEGPSALTDELQATNFGFALNEGATVLGIVAEVERSASSANKIKDWSVKLLKGGVRSGSQRRESVTWPTTDAYTSYGGSDDLWGEEWTHTDINDSGFGLAFQASLLEGSATARVDHIRLTVYYTEADDSNRVCFAGRSIELRSDGIYRQAPEDDVWGKIPAPAGSYPTAPPSGLEERPYRAILIPTQGDLDTIPDSGDNSLSAQAHVRAGYGVAREAAGEE